MGIIRYLGSSDTCNWIRAKFCNSIMCFYYQRRALYCAEITNKVPKKPSRLRYQIFPLVVFICWGNYIDKSAIYQLLKSVFPKWISLFFEYPESVFIPFCNLSKMINVEVNTWLAFSDDISTKSSIIWQKEMSNSSVSYVVWLWRLFFF